MKKITLEKTVSLCLLLLFAFTISAQEVTAGNKKIDPELYSFSEGVHFKILKIYSKKESDVGSRGNVSVFTKANKNQKFKTLYFKFENQSAQDVTLNFADIYLVDGSGNKYRAVEAVQAMKMTFSAQLEFTLKKGKSKSYMVDF